MTMTTTKPVSATNGMSAKQIATFIRLHNFYDLGEALGFEDNVTAELWKDALKACKKPADRSALRDGFVKAKEANGSTRDAAYRRFSRLAQLYTPQSSRKAKSNKAKAEKAETIESATDAAEDESPVHTLSESQLKRNVVQATVMLAMLQEKANDPEIAKGIGEVLATLVQKGKRKSIGQPAPTEESEAQ